MSQSRKKRIRQRQILSWAQGGICAGCGRPVGFKGGKHRGRPSYPTFDHVVPKAHGGHRVLINGLLKHRICNETRDNQPPTGCDRVWQAVVLARLASDEAAAQWGVQLSSRTFLVTGREMRAPFA